MHLSPAIKMDHKLTGIHRTEFVCCIRCKNKPIFPLLQLKLYHKSFSVLYKEPEATSK